MANVIEQHRSLLGSARAGRRFIAEMVASQLRFLDLSVDDLAGFTKWLYADATICPGWRLLQEATQELRSDTGASVRSSDVPDMTHLYLIPYVRAATMDRKWREYISRVTRKLVSQGVAVSYPVFANLGDVRAYLARTR